MSNTPSKRNKEILSRGPINKRNWCLKKNLIQIILGNEMWMGLEDIYTLTNASVPMTLKIEMTDFSDTYKEANYDNFRLENAVSNMYLNILIASLSIWIKKSNQLHIPHPQIKFFSTWQKNGYRGEILKSWLCSKTKLRQPTEQNFFSTFPKESSHFLQTKDSP